MSNGDLVGQDVADLTVGEASEYRATFDQADLFDDLPTADGRLPFVLGGTVTAGSGSAEPPELLAAINGTLAGVVGGYIDDGDGWDFRGYVADLYRPGANDVELYEVTGTGPDAVLHLVASA